MNSFPEQITFKVNTSVLFQKIDSRLTINRTFQPNVDFPTKTTSILHQIYIY